MAGFSWPGYHNDTTQQVDWPCGEVPGDVTTNSDVAATMTMVTSAEASLVEELQALTSRDLDADNLVCGLVALFDSHVESTDCREQRPPAKLRLACPRVSKSQGGWVSVSHAQPVKVPWRYRLGSFVYHRKLRLKGVVCARVLDILTVSLPDAGLVSDRYENFEIISPAVPGTYRLSRHKVRMAYLSQLGFAIGCTNAMRIIYLLQRISRTFTGFKYEERCEAARLAKEMVGARECLEYSRVIRQVARTFHFY